MATIGLLSDTSPLWEEVVRGGAEGGVGEGSTLCTELCCLSNRARECPSISNLYNDGSKQ